MAVDVAGRGGRTIASTRVRRAAVSALILAATVWWLWPRDDGAEERPAEITQSEPPTVLVPPREPRARAVPEAETSDPAAISAPASAPAPAKTWSITGAIRDRTGSSVAGARVY